MRWSKSGKVQISEADLAVLSSGAFRDKDWARPEAWFEATGFPPVSSAMLFTLLTNRKETNPKLLWAQYRRLLEVSNDLPRYYRQHSREIGGKTRLISQPMYPLAGYQYWILKNILERAETTDCAFAYKKGLSLADHARVHRGKRILIKLDLAHFFDSISYGMVYAVFSEQMHYPKEGATLLANLCCLDGRLPQGACTSPCLSNLCMSGIDREIQDYCREKGLRYTRYSDDMTFSGERADVRALVKQVERILRKRGFSLNYRKIHVEGKGKRHKVTGIVCNDKINTPTDYRRKLRQEMYFLQKFGPAEHLKRLDDPRYRNDAGEADVEKYLSALQGRVAYVLQVDPENGEFSRYRDLLREMRKARIKGEQEGKSDGPGYRVPVADRRGTGKYAVSALLGASQG